MPTSISLLHLLVILSLFFKTRLAPSDAHCSCVCVVSVKWNIKEQFWTVRAILEILSKHRQNMILEHANDSRATQVFGKSIWLFDSCTSCSLYDLNIQTLAKRKKQAMHRRKKCYGLTNCKMYKCNQFGNGNAIKSYYWNVWEYVYDSVQDLGLMC